jgi:hypothetical protein
VKPSSGQVESLSEGKDTKKSLSSKKINEKYGLSMPFYVQEQEKKKYNRVQTAFPIK